MSNNLFGVKLLNVFKNKSGGGPSNPATPYYSLLRVQELRWIKCLIIGYNKVRFSPILGTVIDLAINF